MSKDYVWLNEYSQQYLESDYLVSGQSLDERVDVICQTIAKILGDKLSIADKFKENLKKGWYSLSTPIWANFGTDRGLPISCFSSTIEDNMASILYTNAEVGMMTKYGGGTAAYFGDLRGRGHPIKNNGYSSGAVHFMQMFDSQMSVISQGSTRRGNFAAYLPINHPDIMEFLKIKSEGFLIQDLSFGVCVEDEWLQSMKDGDKEKRKIWAKVLEVRANVGYPYIIFTDNVNKNTADVYIDKEMKITHSNLCIAGDQRVVTSLGYLTAKELCELDIPLSLFDGEKEVKSSKMKLREHSADIFKITLENGLEHRITGYHPLPVLNTATKQISKTLCQDLKVGDIIAIQTNKGLFGELDMPKEAFLLGLYQGDGTQTKTDIMLDLWENDFDLEKEIQEAFNYIHFKYNCDNYGVINQTARLVGTRRRNPATFHTCNAGQSNVAKKRLSSRTLKKALDFKKGIVPDWIWKSSEKTQWQYVRGLLYSDGTCGMYNGKGDSIQVSLASIDLTFLKDVQLIFNNLGLQSSIRLLRKSGQNLLPDGKGGKKYYHTKDCWRLIVSNKASCIELDLNTGFLKRKSINLSNRKYRDNTKKGYKISSIMYEGREPVYCPTVESEDHIFISQGFKTFNCSEIFLPTSATESFVCDLSSMNLLHYDDWKDTDAVEVLIYVLDAVMEEFIEKSKNIMFMDRAHNFAKNHRALGLGVLGWHSLLQSKMIPFESMEAKLLNTTIFKGLQKKTLEASQYLATIYGEPKLLKGYGRRNSTTMAIAPTKSSAFILGQVSEGIEPHKSNYYIKDLAKGKFSIRNVHLKDLLASLQRDTSEVWESILKNKGSVQHLDFLTIEQKNVFKTFQEISPREIVIQAASRQKYIDQGQSLNLMINPKTPVKDVNALILEAWELGVKAFYYQIGINAAQELSQNILTCTSCES
jgi:ribonucleoside-diphosphate reductase alpha chain